MGDTGQLLQGVLDGVFDVEELLAVVGLPALLVVATRISVGAAGVKECGLALGGGHGCGL